MSKLNDIKPSIANVSAKEWTNESKQNLWGSLFDIGAVSTCNEDDEATQGMSMLLATILSQFKRSRRDVRELKKAPCEECPVLQAACTRYKSELVTLKQKAVLVDRIQRIMGLNAALTDSPEARTAAFGMVMTQMFDTIHPDSSDEVQQKRKLSPDSSSALRKKRAASVPSSREVDEILDDDDSEDENHPPNPKSDKTLVKTNKESPRKKLECLKETPQRKDEPNATKSSASPQKKVFFSRAKAPIEDEFVLAPESAPAAPRLNHRKIVIPETMCSQIIIEENDDSEADNTQMPFPLTPEKQPIEAASQMSPVIGNKNVSLKPNRSFESRNSPKVRVIETTPDLDSRKSLESPSVPSPSLLQDYHRVTNTTKVKQKVSEHGGGSLSLKNGAFRKVKSRLEADDEIVELAVLDGERRDKKKPGSWQLKPTAEVESVTLNKSASKMRQTKLSLVPTVTNNDLCSSLEFNGGIRTANTSTQMAKEDPDFERAILLSLEEVESDISLKLPARFLQSMNKSGDDVACKRKQQEEEAEPEVLLAEMALPSSLRTRALIADFDKVPNKNKAEPAFAYQRDSVRKQSERMKLAGQDCHSCRQYYQGMDLDEAELKKRLNKCSKHRNNFQQPDTPPGYWDTKFPSTQEFRDRNMDVTQVGQPLKTRKPRRQL